MGASFSRQKFQAAVTTLVETDVSPDDEKFWDQLWTINTSTNDIYELIRPELARTLREEHFENLCVMVSQATAQMCQISHTPEEKFFEQVLNCVRVVTRMLPIILEKEDLEDVDENVELFCWGIPDTTGPKSEEEDAVIGMTLDTAMSDAGDDTISKPGVAADEEAAAVVDNMDDEPIAVLIVHAAMEMLFLRGFGVEFDEEELQTHILRFKQRCDDRPEFAALKPEDDYAMTFVDDGLPLQPDEPSEIWAAGLLVEGCAPPKSHDYSKTSDGSTKAVEVDETLPSRRKYDRRRMEVLRMLMSACCGPIYCTAEHYDPTSSRWLSLLTATNTPHASSLFYSLMNTVFGFDPAMYKSFIYSTSAEIRDSHVKLIETSAQFLCILLDWGLPGSCEQIYGITGPVVENCKAEEEGFNIHRTLLARLDTENELSFLYDGFLRLLKTSYEVEASFLPTSAATVNCFQELVILLWKAMEENPLFLPYVLNQRDVNELLIPICYLMNGARKDPSRSNMVHLCTFILLKLSSERAFGMALREPTTVQLPTDLPNTSGAQHDLIANTMWNCMMDGHPKLQPLYEGFLTIIQNISPYWCNMSLTTAMKLITIFGEFSKHKYLYQEDDAAEARRYLEHLLQTFNTIIHYQYHTNITLIYALVRGKKFFDRINNMTLEKAEEDMNRNLDTIEEEDEESDDEFAWAFIETRSSDDEDDDEKELGPAAPAAVATVVPSAPTAETPVAEVPAPIQEAKPEEDEEKKEDDEDEDDFEILANRSVDSGCEANADELSEPAMEQEMGIEVDISVSPFLMKQEENEEKAENSQDETTDTAVADDGAPSAEIQADAEPEEEEKAEADAKTTNADDAQLESESSPDAVEHQGAEVEAVAESAAEAEPAAESEETEQDSTPAQDVTVDAEDGMPETAADEEPKMAGVIMDDTATSVPAEDAPKDDAEAVNEDEPQKQSAIAEEGAEETVATDDEPKVEDDAIDGVPVSGVTKEDDGADRQVKEETPEAHAADQADEAKHDGGAEDEKDDAEDTGIDFQRPEAVAAAINYFAGIVPKKTEFRPSQEWLEELEDALPMETVTRLIEYAYPMVDEDIAKNKDIIDENKIMAMLKKTTFVGVLPVPHAILVQKFNPNKYTPVWVTAYLWGVIFLNNQEPPLFDGKCVQLFQVRTQKAENQ